MKRNRNRSLKGKKSYIYYPDGTTEKLITIWKAPSKFMDMEPVEINEKG